jgi:hypothetical protein
MKEEEKNSVSLFVPVKKMEEKRRREYSLRTKWLIKIKNA